MNAQQRAFSQKVSAAEVKLLRDQTGSPMMDCKRALQDSGGDLKVAVEWLRKKGMASASKKEGRKSADGLVGVMIDEAGKKGAVIELNSETDFVAKNPVFQKLALEICLFRLTSPTGMSLEDFKLAKLPTGPKSETAVAVGDAVKEMVATVGENCQLRAAAALEVTAGRVVRYIHTPVAANLGKVGVLVALETTATDAAALEQLGIKLAMHIAAGMPLYCRVEDIPEADLAAEKKIFMEQAAESGKPANIAEKMAGGRLAKWKEEVVLEDQQFLISGQDDKKLSVKQVVAGAAASLGAPVAIAGFARVKLGQAAAQAAEAAV